MPKRRQYSQEDLQKALAFIRLKEGSVREAAKKFGVPRSTLQFKTENPNIKSKSGPDPVLSEDEEKELCTFIIDLAKRGFPLKKDDLLLCVQNFINQNPRPNPFKDDKPGDTWFKAFLKRNPNISIRTSEGVTNASSCVAEEDIRKWFQEIKQYFVEESLIEALNDPSRIFNADETGFNICAKSGKVLAEKGSKNVYQIEKAPVKENITVMFAFSASGLVCNPMIIYPYKRIPDKISLSVPTGWGIGRSDTGWMTAAVFHDFIANCFYMELLQKNIQLPVILFVDGHKTHITIEVSQLCRHLKIHLIALYPNATRILQPADVAAFRPIKEGWKKALQEWYVANHYQISMTKERFAPLLKEVVASCAKKETLVNGFRVCGLYPFEPDNVDYSKCIASSSQKTNTRGTNETSKRDAQVSQSCSIDYTDFCEIVGPSIITKCEQVMNIEQIEGDVNFIAIYRIWQKLSQRNLLVDEDSIKKYRAVADDFWDSSPFENNPVIIPTDAVQENDYILDENTGELRQNYIIDKTINGSSAEADKSFGAMKKQDIKQNDHMGHETAVVGKYLEAKPGSSRFLHPDKLVRVISNESMSEYLKNRSPDLPTRQGKRQIERLPFALTSDQYVEIIKSKQLKKQEEEEAKGERKRIREEKKIQKENNAPKKKSRIVKSEVVKKENSVKVKDKIVCCDFCLSPIRKRVLECNQCLKKYHFNCIPSAHRIHVPEDDDEFLCHQCYRESNTDSSDEDEDNFFATICDEVKKHR